MKISEAGQTNEYAGDAKEHESNAHTLVLNQVEAAGTTGTTGA